MIFVYTVNHYRTPPPPGTGFRIACQTGPARSAERQGPATRRRRRDGPASGSAGEADPPARQDTDGELPHLRQVGPHRRRH
jgi:hypothetical protein